MIGYKATRQDLTCRGTQYKIGKTKRHYSPRFGVCEGGLHFCTELVDCLNYYDPSNRFFEVEARWVKNEKTDDSKRVARSIKIVREVFLPLEDRGFQMRMLINNPSNIRYLKNPSPVTQMYAIMCDVSTLQLIKNPTEEVQLYAVKQNGGMISYLENPSEEVQMAAVKQRGTAIKYIDNPSNKVQLYALNESIHAFERIKNPSDAAKEYHKQLLEENEGV